MASYVAPTIRVLIICSAGFSQMYWMMHRQKTIQTNENMFGPYQVLKSLNTFSGCMIDNKDRNICACGHLHITLCLGPEGILQDSLRRDISKLPHTPTRAITQHLIPQQPCVYLGSVCGWALYCVCPGEHDNHGLSQGCIPLCFMFTLAISSGCPRITQLLLLCCKINDLFSYAWRGKSYTLTYQCRNHTVAPFQITIKLIKHIFIQMDKLYTLFIPHW